MTGKDKSDDKTPDIVHQPPFTIDAALLTHLEVEEQPRIAALLTDIRDRDVSFDQIRQRLHVNDIAMSVPWPGLQDYLVSLWRKAWDYG